jgi:hypothetical protein
MKPLLSRSPFSRELAVEGSPDTLDLDTARPTLVASRTASSGGGRHPMSIGVFKRLRTRPVGLKAPRGRSRGAVRRTSALA